MRLHRHWKPITIGIRSQLRFNVSFFEGIFRNAKVHLSRTRHPGCSGSLLCRSGLRSWPAWSPVWSGKSCGSMLAHVKRWLFSIPSKRRLFVFRLVPIRIFDPAIPAIGFADSRQSSPCSFLSVLPWWPVSDSAIRSIVRATVLLSECRKLSLKREFASRSIRLASSRIRTTNV